MQRRAVFDAVVEFANGGSLRTEGFRLDLPEGAGEEDVPRLLVQHLGLAMVGSVELANLEIVEEAHKGSRGRSEGGPTSGDDRRRSQPRHPRRRGHLSGPPAPTIAPSSPGRTRARSTRRAPSSRSTASRWWGTPAPTWTARGTATKAAPTSRGSTSRPWWICPPRCSTSTDATERGIPASVFWDRDVAGKAVLLHTGWDRHFGKPEYAKGAPVPHARGRRLPRSGRASILVGIDSLNIDDTESGGERQAHTGFLAAGIHVVEHLTNLGRPSAVRRPLHRSPARRRGVRHLPRPRLRHPLESPCGDRRASASAGPQRVPVSVDRRGPRARPGLAGGRHR